jgi:hypothetical protein
VSNRILDKVLAILAAIFLVGVAVLIGFAVYRGHPL